MHTQRDGWPYKVFSNHIKVLQKILASGASGGITSGKTKTSKASARSRNLLVAPNWVSQDMLRCIKWMKDVERCWKSQHPKPAVYSTTLHHLDVVRREAKWFNDVQGGWVGMRVNLHTSLDSFVLLWKCVWMVKTCVKRMQNLAKQCKTSPFPRPCGQRGKGILAGHLNHSRARLQLHSAWGIETSLAPPIALPCSSIHWRHHCSVKRLETAESWTKTSASQACNFTGVSNLKKIQQHQK